MNADAGSSASGSAASSLDLVRQEVVAPCRLCVIKVGTRVLTDEQGRLDLQQIQRLADQLAWLRRHGRQVVLVSSGAVGAGIGRLGLERRPNDVASLQAIAAVGQAELIHRYNVALRPHGLQAGQVLLTAQDLGDRQRYLNVRNTLLRLMSLGAIPIVNENDTVAVEELAARFGDNDRLAAMVTHLLRASLLIILSDVEGLYDGDPSLDSSRRIETVTEIDDRIFELVRDRQTGLSRGGMASKLKAAQIVTLAGENAIVASGRREGVIQDVFSGVSVGTLFVASGKSLSPRKRWIGFSAQPKGEVWLDRGAERALRQEGRSLLAIGIRKVTGKFAKGDVITLWDGQGREVGRGLTNYSADELQRIRGLSSQEFADVLNHVPYEEVIHRDNLWISEALTGT